MSKIGELHFEEQREEYEEYGTINGKFVVVHLNNSYSGAASIVRVMGPFTLSMANETAIRYQANAKENLQFLVWPVTPMHDDDYSNDPRDAIMNAWDGEREQPVI